MKKLLLIMTIFLISEICFAKTYECYEGTRHLYHDKHLKPFYTDDFVICRQLEKKHATSKKGKV